MVKQQQIYIFLMLRQYSLFVKKKTLFKCKFYCSFRVSKQRLSCDFKKCEYKPLSFSVVVVFFFFLSVSPSFPSFLLPSPSYHLDVSGYLSIYYHENLHIRVTFFPIKAFRRYSYLQKKQQLIILILNEFFLGIKVILSLLHSFISSICK